MQPIIFVDLDGVLVDLVSGLSERVGRQLSVERTAEFAEAFRSEISGMARNDVAEFYANLPQTRDCGRIWAAVKGYKPKILTSVSRNPGAAYGKEIWCFRNLGIPSDLVYCSWESAEKRLYASPKALLIDDYDRNCREWVEAGGSAILHQDADSTILALDHFLRMTWKYDDFLKEA